MSDMELIDCLSQLSEQDALRLHNAGVDLAADEAYTQKIYASVMEKAGEKGSLNMKKITIRKKRLALLAAAVLLVAGLVTAGAAGVLRLPKNTDELFNATGLKPSDNLLQVLDPEYVENGDLILSGKSVQAEGYTFTLEGVVGASRRRNVQIMKEPVYEGDVEGVYAVITVVRDDGGLVFGYGDGEDEKTIHTIGASPLIHGAMPNVNVYGFMSMERETGVPLTYCEDNVLYLFVDITDFLCFADKGVSVAVYGTMVYSAEEIGLYENGMPYFTDKARAPLAIFELPLDKELADADAQREMEHERPIAYPDLPFTFTGQDISEFYADPVWREQTGG